MTKIADIIEIPRHVHQGDFVLKLAEGVSHPDETLGSYVVTPQLAECFDQALTLIRSAVETGRSKGAYLHGSFGSGKSHFMAVLSLLLRGAAAARSVPELAATVSKHNRWTEGKRFLVVPYHLIGAPSLESAVLGQYASYIRTIHPEAPTPGFYRAERLFEDARRLRETMGDDRFFETLGARSEVDDAWGALDAAWDPDSFEAALCSPPGSEERARVVGDLVDAFFGAHRGLASATEEGFVSLDEGLVILSSHARSLGYDAVVLFLDELILWLASHAADMAFVNREGQKVAKLVEAAHMDRALPIISFIARQRDLRELVGEHMPGAQQLNFADNLHWWEARFDQITLEDRNLPAIVEKRILRPKSAEAASQLAEAFEKTARVREEVLSTLLTRDSDREMFRQVYPFSPALVQTLIAVSSLLQRERTALKLLIQLLVDQRETLELGDLVPVGDLYDVIEAGDEPFTQAMKIRFEQAKRLYRQKLIPLLEEQHGVTLAGIESGAASADTARAFRNDARLLKTLILSSLAEGVEALKALTPARLAALNHGTVRSPIPGMESQMVLTRVRSWAARVGEIKVSDDARNPVISLHLVGVDTEGILENAKSFDNYGNRIQKVRRLLYDMLEIEGDESLLPPRHEIVWKGTKRVCEILFRNVRELPLDNFEPQDAAWRIVIDYPFDLPNFSPRDDLAKVQDYLGHKPPTNTLVWLPGFLTPEALDELGRLVVLDHVLTGKKLDEYGAHLSQLDRDQARVILVNQRDQVRQRVRSFLLAAYGVSSLNRDAVDSALALETHFYSLEPGLKAQPPVAATFGEALEHLFEQALRHDYPAHPDFEGEVGMRGLRKVYDVVCRAAESTDRRVEVDRADRDGMRRIAVPLQLGQMGEAHFVLGDAWVREFEQKRAQDDLAQITVGRLRSWLDRPRPRGLPIEVQNLVILTFALQTNRSFYLHGGLVEPALEKLPSELELREEALPDEADWRVAVERAASVLGVAVNAHRSASNVAKLVENTQKEVAAVQDEIGLYARLLESSNARIGVDGGNADRVRTARATQSFCAAIAGARRDGAVAAIAHADVVTSEAAMAAAIRKARSMREALERTEWELFRANTDLAEPFAQQAATLADRVRDVLRQDEHVTPLAPALHNAAGEAVRLLRDAASAIRSGRLEPRPPEPIPPEPLPAEADGAKVRHSKRVHGRDVEPVLKELRDQARKRPDDLLEIEWRVVEN